MMDTKMVAFAIAACFMAGQILETSSTETITLDELVGVWYSIGETESEFTHSNSIECFMMNIKTEEGSSQNFIMDFTFMQNGQTKQNVTSGKIIGDELTVIFPDLSQRFVFNLIEKYDKGRELIFKKNTTEVWYTMWSRLPSISEQSKLKMEQYATQTNTGIHYINHDRCSYNNSML